MKPPQRIHAYSSFPTVRRIKERRERGSVENMEGEKHFEREGPPSPYDIISLNIFKQMLHCG